MRAKLTNYVIQKTILYKYMYKCIYKYISVVHAWKNETMFNVYLIKIKTSFN